MPRSSRRDRAARRPQRFQSVAHQLLRGCGFASDGLRAKNRRAGSPRRAPPCRRTTSAPPGYAAPATPRLCWYPGARIAFGTAHPTTSSSPRATWTSSSSRPASSSPPPTAASAPPRSAAASSSSLTGWAAVCCSRPLLLRRPCGGVGGVVFCWSRVVVAGSGKGVAEGAAPRATASTPCIDASVAKHRAFDIFAAIMPPAADDDDE
mmetsp:Transcript_27288/g.83788  ORF Transcript_27288/g.83788 Transcript_27288/m.83788 type:complete len:207 (-) Transcript_27288:272-892(-)